MKILALEFSSSQRSVAVWADGRVQGRAEEREEREGRGTKALAMITTALGQAGMEREQIDCIAVGLGPGSYAGVRIAIALAQGWQLARGVKLLGVSSADCVAGQAQAAGWFGRMQLVMDAQRHGFYCASYEIAASGWRETVPFRALAPDGIPLPLPVRNERGEGHPTADTQAHPQARQPSSPQPSPPSEGREGEEIGALDTDSEERAGVRGLSDAPVAPAFVVRPDTRGWRSQDERVLCPDAAMLAQLAAGRTDFVSGESLAPIYLVESTFVKAPPPRIIR